ncbi:MAG TPA: hypothetical protein VFK04_13045 [Gemmatimonadaceae bacterium]|nr:hypothetical protein [Gemmatimonadaceae bacterium]
MRWLIAALAALTLAAPLSAQTIIARVEGVSDSATVRVLPAPAGDVGGDSVPPVVASLFATPREQSPHFDFARYTFTDFCYCWDGAKGDTARALAARRYDLIMSGNLEAWSALNSTADLLPYALVQTVFTEEPDTTKAHKVDANSLSGKYQYDARSWYAQHPQFSYESLYLHDLSPTPTDSASRLHFVIWNNYRYALNPLDPGALAYTIDRLRRLRASRPVGTGLFFDEMDRHAWSWYGRSREGAGVDSTTWHAAVVAFVKAVHDSLGVMTQSNAAEYSPGQFDRAIGVAAGAMHLERMGKATGEMTKTWAFIDSLTHLGVYVDLVSLETFDDFARYGRNFYPPGNYTDAIGRGKTFQLASYYMVVDSLARLVGLQTDNTRGYPPDSVWLPIYQLDVGHPRGKRYVWADTTDALGQVARTYRRDFDNAVVLARPITSYKYPKMTDTTAVPVPLPEGGPWSYVTARGDIVPIDSLELRNSEAVILVRRP